MLRAQTAEQAFQKWAKAVQSLQQVVLETQRIQGQLNAWQVAQREQNAGAVSAGDLMRNYQSVQVFLRLLLGQEHLRKLMEERSQQALAVWQEAHKKEEALLRLKKRSLEKWTKENEVEQQRLSDERATAASFRKFRPAMG